MPTSNSGSNNVFEEIALDVDHSNENDVTTRRTASDPQKGSITMVKVTGILMICAIIVLVIILPVYFEVIVPNQNKGNAVVVTTTTAAVKPEPTETTPHTGDDEKNRFDCFPEGGATIETCQQRGCIWLPPTVDTAAPSCFYSGKDGYSSTEVLEVTSTGFSQRIGKSKTAASPYGEEFDELLVTYTRVSNNKLRITIAPTSVKRFEIPWTHESASNTPVQDTLYDVQFTSTNGLFGIQVTRKSTDAILFDTTVGRMMFSDQFLQISTKLASEYVYGFGEHMHESFKHDMSWKTYGMFSRDQGVGPNANLYGVHPFHMCMERDGNAHGILFLNSNAQDVTMQPTPALTYRSVGGIMDFYIFVGPEPESVVSQYTETIGRPYMPPMWALGFQLCRYGYGSLDKLKKVVDRMLDSEIPYDVQYTDIDYMDRQLDFTINATTYAGLEDFARDLKSTHKMKYIIIFDPAISGNETAGTYPPFDLGKQQNVFIQNPDGEIAFGKVWPDLPGIYINTTWEWDDQTATFRAHAAFPDYFNPVTIQWWSDLTVDFHKRLEFDGLWIDMNEPASFVHGSPNGCPDNKWDNPLPYHPAILGNDLFEKTTCMSNLQYNPQTQELDVHYNMHSLYGWSQTKPTLDACRLSTGKRCMVISRSTFPGSGKYTGHWLGDNTSLWSHLRASIIGMLEFNLFGIPYIGADICGFFQDTTEELCMRWMQLGAFYPFSRNHNGLGSKDQDPAAFGPEFIAASKKVLEIRYSILPYFYTLFYDAHTTGSTVIRSLLAEFPTDITTYTIETQFLLGGNILISPVLHEGEDSVKAYVPDATWYDYYTGAKLATGLRKTFTYFHAPWDHIPIHIKGGSIIPTQTPARTTELQRSNGLGIIYAIGDSLSQASGHLFWDDWDSIDDFENGVFLMLSFSGDQESLSSMVEHNEYPDADSSIFDHVTVMGVHGEQVSRVIVNGVTHSQFTFDSNTKMLQITGLNLQLTKEWTIVWDTNQYADRFNCHPESSIKATQLRCLNRGCLWHAVSIPGVPPCYYPANYGAYKKDTAPMSTTAGEELYLERSELPEFFEGSVQRLKVEVEEHSEYQLRIKIIDANNPRYEVPMTLGGVNPTKPSEPLYEVIYQDQPFAFKVVRRSTREVIMDTNVGGFIFEDQFIQISTKAATDYLYGLGEAEHANHKHDFYWTKETLHAKDEGVKQNANLYGYHPFHLTMEKQGSAHGVLLLNSNAMEVELTPLPSITYRTIGGILDFYLFLGPTPNEVVQQYSSAVGKPMQPPYWALGFQLCKYGYGNMDELRTVVDGMRNYQIPYDVQYGDIDYMDRQLDFTIDPINYPNLPTFVNTMREDYKMRYVVILDPAISANETDPYPPYTDGVTADIFIRQNDGELAYGLVWPDVPGTLWEDSTLETRAHVLFPDFFNPATQQWWANNIARFYNEIKFDGLWIDMNEPANFVNGSLGVGCPALNKYDHPPYLPGIIGDTLYTKTLCMSSKQYNPSTSTVDQLHYNVHSMYGWSQAQPTKEACQAATGKRCYVISRSTYPGAGAHTGHWLGDNESKWSHMKASIIGMFEFTLFGFSYTGADICGFFEDAEEEMCLRWSQLGAFYPFSRNHAMLGTKRQDPASWGPEFAASVKKVLETRYTLLPYLYTLFYHSHTRGDSVVRPLMHEFPTDSNTWEIDTQFLWGPALLITPVLEQGKLTVEGYMADTRWFDYYSGAEVAQRKATVTLSAPMDYINLHIRGGYILPTQEPAVTTYYSRQNDFGLVVALDDNMKASGDLYWDDGESQNAVIDKLFTYSTFTCEGNVLENRIITDGSSNMTLGTIVVMGLKDDVTQVFMRDQPLSMSQYTQDSTTKKLTILVKLSLHEEFMVRWEVNNEWARIACMLDLQEGKVENRADCATRGCVWRLSTTPGVPSCFHDNSNNHGYIASQASNPAGLLTYDLVRKAKPTIYGGDVDNLKLGVEYQTDNRLHFKLTDPSSQRWEIPQAAVNIPTTISSDATNSKVVVDVTDDPFSIKVTRKDNNEVIFDSSVGPLIYSDQFLQISTSLPSLNVYGFGEHNHKRYRHDLNWRRWGIFTRDVAPVDDWNLYGHHTFYMALHKDGKAYGVYLHNSNAMDILLQPTPAVTYRVTGGVLDFYLFVGDSPEALVQEYHKIIGFPVLPPYWGLGFQLSRWDYGSLDRVKEVVQEMRDARIPFDIQYGDIDYMDAKKDFTYDPVKYAGLPAYVDQLHDWGMRYVIILDPGIKIEPGYKAYDEGMQKNIFMKNPDGTTPVLTEVWPGDTYHPDFTHSAASQWWTDQCRDFHDNQGVHFDALWIDMNEPANFQTDDPTKRELMNCTGIYNFPPYLPRILGYWVGMYDKTFCMDNVQEWGLHYNVHSLYGHTMTQATYRTLENLFPDKRSFTFSRSTFAGSGKYSGHWLGDNQSLWPQMAWPIPGMFEFNLFGFPYIGADICGFWFNTTTEMCTRWTQVGAFYPFSRNHNGAGMNPQHPTAFGDDFSGMARDVLQTRYQILPYMYTLFSNVHANGGTVVRALLHEFPTNPQTWNLDRMFLLGPAFLVTPVLDEGKVDVTGYFPQESRWFDFRTGMEQVTGKFLTLDAPMDYINLHVRGGYILPMQGHDVTTTLSRKKPMEILVALDDSQSAAGELYWDDGEARNVGENFTRIEFKFGSNVLNFTVVHQAEYLPELDILYINKLTVYGLLSEPSVVTCDGNNEASFTWESVRNRLIVYLFSNLNFTDDHQCIFTF
ncbi:sucrase-isomaltase, intestinal [Ciona intestinalis]